MTDPSAVAAVVADLQAALRAAAEREAAWKSDHKNAVAVIDTIEAAIDAGRGMGQGAWAILNRIRHMLSDQAGSGSTRSEDARVDPLREHLDSTHPREDVAAVLPSEQMKALTRAADALRTEAIRMTADPHAPQQTTADLVADREQFTLETPQGERITYFAAPTEGRWMAHQEGMPDEWWLSRVASRAVTALIAARAELNALHAGRVGSGEVEAETRTVEGFVNSRYVGDDNDVMIRCEDAGWPIGTRVRVTALPKEMEGRR